MPSSFVFAPMHQSWERAVLADDNPVPVDRPSQNALPKSIEHRPLGRTATGDRPTLRSLHSNYFPGLARLFSHLSPASDFETVAYLVNETLLAVSGAGEDFHPDHSAYVRIMRLAVDQVRYRLGNDALFAVSLRPDLALGEDLPSSSRTLLRPLSLEQRAVMYLVYTGHSRQTIGDVMRLSSDSVDALLSQARIEMARRRPPAGIPPLPIKAGRSRP